MNCPNCDTKLPSEEAHVHINKRWGGEVRVTGGVVDNQSGDGFVCLIATDSDGKTVEVYMDPAVARETTNGIRRALRIADPWEADRKRYAARRRRWAKRNPELEDRTGGAR